MVTYGPFSPFLPTIGRVHQVLCQMERTPGQVIETNNRAIAEAAQCSPSAIPEILRDLEALDYIERATGPRGSLIQVLDRSGMPDRSPAPAPIDQESDRFTAPAASDQESAGANRANRPDRSSAAETHRSPMSDPPPHPPYMEKNSIAAVATAAADESDSNRGSGGASAADRWPDRADVASRLDELNCQFTDEVLAARPQLTLAKLDEQWAIAQQREAAGGLNLTARDLLFGVLRKPDGGWLYGRAPSSAPNWGAYAQEQAAAAAQPPPDAAPDDFAAARARAHQLAPDATPGELDILAADLQEGRSPDEALDWLRNERGRRAKLAERAQVRGGAYA